MNTSFLPAGKAGLPTGQAGINKIVLYFLVAFLAISSFSIAQKQKNNFEEDSKKLTSALQIIDLFYVDTANNNKLVEAAIINMLKELDPHSVYMTEEETKESNEPLQGAFEGIGVQFNIIKDTIMVVSPTPGGPSEKLGIMPGDKIVKINGEDATGSKINNNYVVKHLRGTKGTTVNISIKRKGKKELLDYTITRDKIPINSIDATFMASSDIGYIKLNRFGATTIEEFDQSIKNLKASGMKNLILDLRGNGGGYLNTAIDLADEFLGKDKLVVYTQGNYSTQQKSFATEKGDFQKGKLIILIDEGSVSASEIVSGAIQDWDRGLIMGRRSFGKGLVQRPFPLPDGSVIRLTTARYYTPTGRCIQKPYNEGTDKYYKDLTDRFKHGESFHPDSIHFPDSLKYYTPKKRLVYGGGGIMPDIFVPADTSMISDYYVNIQRKGLMYLFSLQLLDRSRDSLMAKYKNADSFVKNFIVDSVFLNKFIAYADKELEEKKTKVTDPSNKNLNDSQKVISQKDIDSSTVKEKEKEKKKREEINLSKKYIINQLKANIGRSLFDINTYFLITANIDDVYKKAIEAMNDKTFKQYKID
ncbi:MAG: S41 family peptidase [Bacteroidales bacterium]